MATKNFALWGKEFVEESESLPGFLLDGLSTHLTCDAPKALKGTGIVAIALSPHNSPALKPLVLAVDLWNKLNYRTPFSERTNCIEYQQGVVEHCQPQPLW